MNRLVVISGCSGGGKSALLAHLAERGYGTVEEPGRNIVREELSRGGTALPWSDAAAFARRALDMAVSDYRKAALRKGIIFFDRGVIDAAAALQHATGQRALETIAREHPYDPHMFMVPPWPEIYRTDKERKHGLDEAVREYDLLLEAYRMLGYEVTILPKTDIARRADTILSALGLRQL